MTAHKAPTSWPMPPLIRTLRLQDLLLLFIGSVIGSGIFLTPGLILRPVDGSVGLSLLVWVMGGILSLLGRADVCRTGRCQSGSGRAVLLHSRRIRAGCRRFCMDGACS